LRACYTCRFERIRKDLERALSDPEEEVREETVKLLFAYDDPRAERILFDFVAGKYPVREMESLPWWTAMAEYGDNPLYWTGGVKTDPRLFAAKLLFEGGRTDILKVVAGVAEKEDLAGDWDVYLRLKGKKGEELEREIEKLIR